MAVVWGSVVAPAAMGGDCAPEWLNQWWQGEDPNLSVQAIVELPSDFPGGGGWVVAGGFTSIGGQPLARIARWDGKQWHPLGAGIDGNGTVLALEVMQEGSAWVLIAGGSFTSASGVAASRIARWDGMNWSPLGAGLNGSPGVLALEVYNEGSGPQLFAAGVFTVPGNTSFSGIARWNGVAWTAVGDDALSVGSVQSLRVHDDGTGSALYMGGEFLSVGDIPGTRGIACWNGKEWSAVGGGLTGPLGVVNAIEAFPVDGTPELHIGGLLWAVGGVPAYALARWDGNAWTSVEGLVGYPDDQFHIEAMHAHDDGAGPALFVGGRFQGIEGAQSGSIAKWDGELWHSMGTGVGGTQLWNGDVVALCSATMDGAPTLLVGGYFTSVNGEPHSRLSAWVGCAPSCVGDIDGDGLVNFVDLNLLLGEYNEIGEDLSGDLDGDGDVDFADLNLLLGVYNSAC